MTKRQKEATSAIVGAALLGGIAAAIPYFQEQKELLIAGSGLVGAIIAYLIAKFKG